MFLLLKKKEWGIATILIVSIVGVLYYTTLFQTAASCILYPALLAQSYLVEPTIQRMTRTATIRERYESLKNEHEQLQEQVVKLQAAVSYFEGTKELREFNQRYKKEGRICQVLVRTLSDHEQTFLIEGGEQAGHRKDMMVSYRSAVIGRVMEVYPWYSKVCLITDKRCKIGAYCSGTRAQGVLQGYNESQLARLQYVDHLAHVKKGDLLLTSGEGMIFPEGFGLGRISSVEKKGLYQEVRVAPLVHLNELNYCLVGDEREGT